MSALLAPARLMAPAVTRAAGPQRTRPEDLGLEPPELCFGPRDQFLLGRIAGGMLQPKLTEALDNLKTAGLKARSFKSLGLSSLRSGAMGAGLSAVYAGIHRGSAYLRGEITREVALGDVAADAAGGFCTGTASGLGSGASSLLFRSLGVAGIPLSLGSATVGAMSGIGMAQFYDWMGLRQRVSHSVQTWLCPQQGQTV